ncbi:hypothetical protein [Epilithonimonas sp.]|uniref:hypothetical protein n=1 Tax=Epilithonimonas sp. TaxID=2894511 RepID=UPI002FDD4971
MSLIKLGNIFQEYWGETSESYFTDRNFKQNPLLKGSINGGVFIFRPKIAFGIFKDYYYSNHNQGELNSFEETPFAYFSQIYDWFEPSPLKFNAQVLYKMKGTEKGRIVEREEQKIWKFFRKIYYKKTENSLYPTSNYKKLVEDIMKNNYFIHFSGKYPLYYR